MKNSPCWVPRPGALFFCIAALLGLLLNLCFALPRAEAAASHHKKEPSTFLRMCLSKNLTEAERGFVDFLRKDNNCYKAKARLKEIEILYLGPNDYVNWQVIGELVNLRDLAIEGMALDGLGFVRPLKNLQMLVLVGIRAGRPLSVEPLAKLAHLSLLRIAATPVEQRSLRALLKQHPRLQLDQHAGTISRLFIAP